MEHWVLLVVKVKDKLIQLFDPAGSLHANGLVQSLIEFLRNEVFFEKAAYIQWRSFACKRVEGSADKLDSGLYVLKAIENLWVGSEEPITNLELLREELCRLIIR